MKPVAGDVIVATQTANQEIGVPGTDERNCPACI